MAKQKQSTSVAPSDLSNLPADVADIFESAAPIVDPASRRTPWVSWNVKGEDADGNRTQKDWLYHSQDNIPLEAIRAVILEVVRVGAVWSHYDERAQETIRWCRSNDRVTGDRSDSAPEQPGQSVGCDDCGKQRWFGKNKPECTRFEDVAMFDLDAERVFMVRFKVTGLKHWHEFLRRHIQGRYKGRDLPFIAGQVSFSAIMDLGGGDYAVPKITPICLNDHDSIRRFGELRKQVLAELKLQSDDEPEEKPVAAAQPDDSGRPFDDAEDEDLPLPF